MRSGNARNSLVRVVPFFAGSSEKELIKEESSLRQTILLQIERKEGGALFDNTKVEICLEG